MGVTDSLKLPFPELTDTADGPDGFSDLANSVEDYFYDRILPAGISRMPSYYWGSGTAFPTGTALRPGDTFVHTGVGAVFRYVGTTGNALFPWEQASIPTFATAAARDAMATAYGSVLPHGFVIRQSDISMWMKWDGLRSPNAWVFGGFFGEKNGNIAFPNGHPYSGWQKQALALPTNSGSQKWNNMTFVSGWQGMLTWDATNRQFTSNIEGLMSLYCLWFSDGGIRSEFNTLKVSSLPNIAQGSEDHRHVPNNGWGGAGLLRSSLVSVGYVKQGTSITAYTDTYNGGAVGSQNHDIYFSAVLLPSGF